LFFFVFKLLIRAIPQVAVAVTQNALGIPHKKKKEFHPTRTRKITNTFVITPSSFVANEFQSMWTALSASYPKKKRRTFFSSSFFKLKMTKRAAWVINYSAQRDEMVWMDLFGCVCRQATESKSNTNTRIPKLTVPTSLPPTVRQF